jgi:hypothetical protein
VREKYCWLVADKPSEQTVGSLLIDVFQALAGNVAVFDSDMEKKLAVGFRLGLDVYKVAASIPLRTCSRRLWMVTRKLILRRFVLASKTAESASWLETSASGASTHEIESAVS